MRKVSLSHMQDVAPELKLGEEVALSGTLFIARDMAHVKLLEHVNEHGSLPFDMAGGTIFYAGPSPAQGDLPFGAVGPTTSSRMDFATPDLLEAGIAATIGKGERSADVATACARFKAPYFAAIGGVAALLATHIISSKILAWEDLGPEALRVAEVRDFPVFVAIDTNGKDLYQEIASRALHTEAGD